MNNYEINKNQNSFADQEIILQGWIRSNRAQAAFGFLSINDGSTLDSVQVIYTHDLINFKDIQKFNTGAALFIKGILKLTPNNKQPYEIKATYIELVADSSEDFPIQPKKHTREFLRELPHLRVRTNLFNAVFRVRSVAQFAVHSFFQENNFINVHTPIITNNDGEGAGEAFSVTTLPLEKIPFNSAAEVDYKKDFFHQKASLCVTGQLEAEAFALAFKNVYTFGPTFRAEKSNTPIHASEFWMIEPEMAFTDLNGNMDIMEKLLKYVVTYCLNKLPNEFALFNQFVQPGLINKLNSILNSSFHRITHHDAISILLNSNQNFTFTPAYGQDLATEHEKYLTEHFKIPVFITNWPKEIKAFYMRDNGDGTVAAVDLLVPGSGELMGGSQREERLDLLISKMKQLNIPIDDLKWYLDLRRYGGCYHSGFGVGFERLLIYLTGVENIRDVIPFPRTSGKM